MDKKLKLVEKERKSMSVHFIEFTKKVEKNFETLENKIEFQRLHSKIEKINESSLKNYKFKCNLCTFTSISEAGLKTHSRNKHKHPTVTQAKEFPQ